MGRMRQAVRSGMGRFRQPLSLFAWLFVRLPWAFSVPLIVLTAWWFLFGYHRALILVGTPLYRIGDSLLTKSLPIKFSQSIHTNLEPVIQGLIAVLLFTSGFLVTYNLCAGINGAFLKLGLKPIRYPKGSPIPPAEKPCSQFLQHFNKIGIVLSGGGAKGAFQAGAMKAIYRFLDDNGAIGKVSTIAGTSIGSWNALFWLADLVKPELGWNGESVHEKWWQRISAKSLTAPGWYVPSLRNSFLSTLPWRFVFDRIFIGEALRTIKNSKISFFLTRSNVQDGRLTYATNYVLGSRASGMEPDFINPKDDDKAFKANLRKAVFASMDIPPLFPYEKINRAYFEDGGVIDNLPIELAALDGCDLIFILPLNANFDEPPNLNLIVRRLFRVMDVRQGALEREGFKLVYLYNELADLRDDAKRLRRMVNEPESLNDQSTLASALKRAHRHINVFAVCPSRQFVTETINTWELWKSRQAAKAFGTMYDATWRELGRYNWTAHQTRVRMAVIDKCGNERWVENF